MLVNNIAIVYKVYRHVITHTLITCHITFGYYREWNHISLIKNLPTIYTVVLLNCPNCM